MKTKSIIEIAILAALISIVGAIKIPNLIPGLEFQLSAPLAIAICVSFGFKKYIIAGCISSLLGLLLGTQTIVNVMIALQFRLIVGLIIYLGQRHILSIIIAGPIASTLSRISLGIFFGKLSIALVAAAIPGMIFTAIMAPILSKVMILVVKRSKALSATTSCLS